MATSRSPSLTSFALAALCVSAIGCGSVTTQPARSDNVPNGAHAIDVVSTVTGQRPVATVAVTDARKVGQIVDWIDHMGGVPPGAYSCPTYIGVQPTVTLTFRTRAHGTVLATASETDYGSGSGPCNPLTVNVPRRGHRALLGNSFLERLERLLDVNLGFGLGRIKAQIYAVGGPMAPNRQQERVVAGTLSLYLGRGDRGSGRFALLAETIDRPGQFTFTAAPGPYQLSGATTGMKPDCPRTTVVVRVGRTTDAEVPVGCSTRRGPNRVSGPSSPDPSSPGPR